MAQGFNPYIAEWSPYHGAAYAVIEATARLAAAGANWSKARFSYQEYLSVWINKQSVLVNQYQLSLEQLKLRFNWFAIYRWKDSHVWYLEELTVPPTLVGRGDNCR